MREFDMETIQMINAFENITGSEVRDCIKDDTIYFLVNPGKAAIAIGKNGQRVQVAEKMIGKPIKILEFDSDLQKFIKNLVPFAEKIEIKGDRVIVNINNKKRGIVIGKAGKRIKVLREFLQRNTELRELKIL